MDYNTLLDIATDLGYELAMSGAETFRVEETINRVLAAYGVESEVFAIPNCLTVSIETEDGQLMTRMRRIGAHGNDLDTVERFNGLSRAICNRKPAPQEAKKWLEMVHQSRLHYSFPAYLLGNFLGGAGFAVFFGGNWMDFICGGICGGAQVALAEAGIKLYGGVSGDADAAVQALLDGKLEYNPNVMCSHHGHGDSGHSCGDHGCGSHGCGSHGCH